MEAMASTPTSKYAVNAYGLDIDQLRGMVRAAAILRTRAPLASHKP